MRHSPGEVDKLPGMWRQPRREGDPRGDAKVARERSHLRKVSAAHGGREGGSGTDAFFPRGEQLMAVELPGPAGCGDKPVNQRRSPFFHDKTAKK